MSKVVIVSSSIRGGSNSEALARAAANGAKAAGHEVTEISLKGKTIGFCKGCLACQRTLKCVIADDANEIAETVKNADTVVFATPIYYYEMSGQLKTLLDRMNSLYPSEYCFRNIYMMTVAAAEDDNTPLKAVNGLQGWVDCFTKAELKGNIFFGGLTDSNGVTDDDIKRAEEFGSHLD